MKKSKKKIKNNRRRFYELHEWTDGTWQLKEVNETKTLIRHIQCSENYKLYWNGIWNWQSYLSRESLLESERVNITDITQEEMFLRML